MSSDDVFIVVRVYNNQLQYLTKKDIWSLLPADAKKFPAYPADKLTSETEVWRMAPVEGEPGYYRVVSEYQDTNVQPKKRGKKA